MSPQGSAEDPVVERIRNLIRMGRAPDTALLEEVAEQAAVVLGSEGTHAMAAGLGSRVLGLGELDPLLEDPSVTDVLVNGDGSVWLDRGRGAERSAVRVASGDGSDPVRRLAVRLAGAAGRRLDEAQPWVDGQLPGGVRLHAVLPPLADGGAHISLRVPRRHPLSLADLEGRGMLSPTSRCVLAALVHHRVSFVVSGGTGSGKTTLLGALLAQVPAHERLVVVEDVRELGVAHPHVVRLQARHPNVEGRGEVTMEQLVRQALRMRPDRIVVGEVRGGEVREMLSALNTGHEGGCGTVHANHPHDLPARLEALGAVAGMTREAVHAQAGAALEAVVHVCRAPDGLRVLSSVSLLSRPRDGLEVTPVLVRRDGVDERGPGWSALCERLGRVPTPGAEGEW